MKKKYNFNNLLGKEVKVTLDNGVNLYGILESYIQVKSGNIKEDEVYINSKGNIMGILESRISYIVENV